jgi:hypothetical protein
MLPEPRSRASLSEIDPFILGMPFPLGWISVWVVLTAIIMAVVYLIDPANREDAP